MASCGPLYPPPLYTPSIGTAVTTHHHGTLRQPASVVCFGSTLSASPVGLTRDTTRLLAHAHLGRPGSPCSAGSWAAAGCCSPGPGTRGDGRCSRRFPTPQPPARSWHSITWLQGPVLNMPRQSFQNTVRAHEAGTYRPREGEDVSQAPALRWPVAIAGVVRRGRATLHGPWLVGRCPVGRGRAGGRRGEVREAVVVAQGRRDPLRHLPSQGGKAGRGSSHGVQKQQVGGGFST